MTEKARVFVGCDDRSKTAEQALMSSIRRNATIEVDFIWVWIFLAKKDCK